MMSPAATVIIFDNSDFMRNQDFEPSRYEAQIEAFNYVCEMKGVLNSENSSGLMTMVNNKIIVNLTYDVPKLSRKVTTITIGGDVKFLTSIKVAKLALRHRQKAIQRKRVFAFVGSPIVDSEDDIVKLAKTLKKDDVAVDVISFGEIDHNREKLTIFINNLNSNDSIVNNSQLVEIPLCSGLKQGIIMSNILFADMYAVASTPYEPALDYDLGISMEEHGVLYHMDMEDDDNDITIVNIGFPELTRDDMRSLVPAASLGESSRKEMTSMAEEEQIADATSMPVQDSKLMHGQVKSVRVEEHEVGSIELQENILQVNGGLSIGIQENKVESNGIQENEKQTIEVQENGVGHNVERDPGLLDAQVLFPQEQHIGYSGSQFHCPISQDLQVPSLNTSNTNNNANIRGDESQENNYPHIFQGVKEESDDNNED